MPIYEFHCEKCERDSEILVRSRDWTGTKCPHCGSTKVSKKFSVFASSSGASQAPACSGVPSSCGICFEAEIRAQPIHHRDYSRITGFKFGIDITEESGVTHAAVRA